MLVSIGQGGNQLAACVWQRAQQQQQQQQQRAAHSTSAARPKHTTTTSRSHAGATSAAASSSSSTGGVSSSSGAAVPPVPASPWFAMDGYAHAVVIDSEPKVVAQMDRLGRALAVGAATGAGNSATRSRLLKQQQQLPHLPASPAVAAQSIFRPSNLKLEQYGRGNNWAMGYFGREGDEGRTGSLLSSTLECVRREAERMDSCSSLVLLHSLAGGTGSGLGSRVAEEVREAFPKHFLLSVSIAPFGTGDTPLQHYNTLLSLAHLYPAVDGLVLASNADISRALTSLSVHRGAGASIATLGSAGGSGGGGVAPLMSFAGINTYLSACVADLLAPTRTVPSLRQMELEERRRTLAISDAEFASASAPVTVESASSLLATPSLYELVSHVAPLPAYKLLEVWSSAGLGASSSAAHFDPRAGWQPSWKGCVESLHRFVPRDNEELAAGLFALDARAAVLPGAGRSVAYTVHARGDSAADPVDACYESIAARMQRLFPAASWQPHPLDLVATALPRLTWRPEERTASHAPQCESTRSLSVCVNRSRTSLTLAPSVRKARLLLKHKAYVHWYTRYGVEVSEMHDAIDSIEDVIRDYQTI